MILMVKKYKKIKVVMKKDKVVIIGSTGSIGTQTIDVKNFGHSFC